MALTGRAVWDSYLANNILAGDGIMLTPDTNLRQTTIAVRVASGGGLAFVDGELTADVTAIGDVDANPDTIALRDADGSLAMTLAVLGENEAPNLGTLGRDADGRLSVFVTGFDDCRVPVEEDLREYIRIERASDPTGTTQTSTRCEWYIHRDMIVLGAWLVPDVTTTFDDINYGTIEVDVASEGVSLGAFVTATTAVAVGTNPTGDWTEWVPISLVVDSSVLPAANLLPAGSVVTFSVSKTGSKTLPRFVLLIATRPAIAS